MKIGDKVIMNNKYIVSEENKGKIWTVRSEPWECCGTLVVLLVGKGDVYAVDGLDIVMNDDPQLLKKATGEDIGNAAQDTLLPAT